jgi:signal transduction histidine kinase
MSFTADREAFDGTLLPIGARSHHYLTLLRRMPQTDARDQQYYVLQRSLDAETAYLRDIQAGLLQLGALAILAALVAGFIIAERITRPVQILVRAAEDLERGRYDTPIPVDTGDEIGVLARRFQGMRQRLHDYIRGLQEAGRLRSEFIGIASHELRTPISIIQGYFELLDRGDLGTLNAQQQMAVRGIGGSLQMLEGIAEAATRLAQIEGDSMSLEIQPWPVAGLIEQAVSRVTTAAKERVVAVHAEVAPDTGEVRLDGPRLVEALVNLVSNGVRFTPDDGWVIVRAGRAGDDLVIAVKDSGIGIAPEHHAAVLERGFSGRSSLNHHSSSRLEFNSCGLGLGLAIARGIVEAHGGTLTLDSALGRGSTFSVRIPIRKAELAQAA